MDGYAEIRLPDGDGACSAAPTRESSPALPPSAKLGAEPQVPRLLLVDTDAALLRRLAVAREAELEVLRAQRCVSARARPECPVCLCPFDDAGTYPSARPSECAFECGRHDVCYGCAHRLLVTAMTHMGEETKKAFRCPLCRAHGCVDRDDGVRTPDWLKLQLARPDVVAAREVCVPTVRHARWLRACEAGMVGGLWTRAPPHDADCKATPYTRRARSQFLTSGARARTHI